MRIYNKINTQGFTLVELSIVIIIIGLLISGVAAGTSLIKQASLNSVISDFNNYATAYNNFLNRYNEVPGDMSNAYAYWGAKCGTNTTSTPGSCNGNGDGAIGTWSGAGGAPGESLAAWKHLSLAEMISGLPGAVNPNDPTTTTSIIGVDIPGSKINSNVGYLFTLGDTSVNGLSETTDTFWDNGTTNVILIGAKQPTLVYYLPDYGGLSPIDSYNIDQKIDDGHIDSAGLFQGAASGSFRVFEGFSTIANSCLLYTAATGPFSYNPSGQAASCVGAMSIN